VLNVIAIDRTVQDIQDYVSPIVLGHSGSLYISLRPKS